MNPLVQQILGGLVRVALGGVIAWLIQRGIISEDQTELVVGGVVTAVGTVGWIIWNKVQERRVLNTALATSTGSGATVNEIEKSVKAGVFASATTPKDVAPVIQSNTGDGK